MARTYIVWAQTTKPRMEPRQKKLGECIVQQAAQGRARSVYIRDCVRRCSTAKNITHAAAQYIVACRISPVSIGAADGVVVGTADTCEYIASPTDIFETWDAPIMPDTTSVLVNEDWEPA